MFTLYQHFQRLSHIGCQPLLVYLLLSKHQPLAPLLFLSLG